MKSYFSTIDTDRDTVLCEHINKHPRRNDTRLASMIYMTAIVARHSYFREDEIIILVDAFSLTSLTSLTSPTSLTF